MSKKFVKIDASRTDQQRGIMEQIAHDGVCPFCNQYLKKYHKKPVIWKDLYWLVTENDNPYEGTSHHLLLIAVRHLESPKDLTAKEGVSLFEAIRWVIETFQIPGGAVIMRFGDMDYNGSSVQHLHAHVIVGEKESEDTESLRVKLGNKKK